MGRQPLQLRKAGYNPHIIKNHEVLMKKLFLRFAFAATFISTSFAHAESFYDFKYTDTSKKEVNFKDLKGKTVMVVNIATRCGYTGQLDDIEKLSQKYKDKNFVVLGFPSNEFNEQAPESNEDIAKFCRLKYGATFPIFEKQIILGKNKTGLYKWLTSQKGYTGEIGWNFTKFLVDKEGRVVARFDSKTEPLSKEITSIVEKNI